MPDIVDDKSPHVIPFILSRYAQHRRTSSTPFIIGLNGVQGIGKTTLVESLAATLHAPPHCLQTLTLSIDDFYLPAASQQALATANASNPLLQQRGQPSTHDAQLARQTFAALRSRKPDIRIPSYDKSALKGRGDRRPDTDWKVANPAAGPTQTVDVVIFEGWCVGFRALGAGELRAKWSAAREALLAEGATSAGHPGPQERLGEEMAGRGVRVAGRLGGLALPHVEVVNDALARMGYEELFGGMDAFVYLEAEDPFYVYEWRGEQEDELRRAKGEQSAMSREEVRRFVDGYFPAYEVYVDSVREGVFRGVDGEMEEGKQGAQMRLVVGRDRSVLRVEVV